ncbi:MAG: InlB B-repeat-containing protein, partial [Abditibacteriota bacterium]|nr:InlB B-repeat-containing protein [Abditibacteriota bacterium]
PHTHSFNYSATGATITATCGVEGCPLTDKKATLSIAPSSSGGSAAELTGDVDEFDLTVVTITYQKKDSAGWQNTTEPDANATGIFKASVTLKGADNAEVTASTAYGVSAITKGSATGDATDCDFTVPKVAGVGAKIEPTPTLPTGYEIKKITVKDESQNDVSTDVSADTKGFIMPEYSVTVDIEFGKISSAITIVQPNTGGTITVKNGDATLSSGTSADYGDAITLSNTSATGFNFVSYKVTKTGDENTTIEASNGSFSMPHYPVTVTATFEGAPFGITTVCDPTIGGTVEITGGGVTTNENATTAKAGTEVTLTVNPATGFNVGTVKYNDTTITASEGAYKFTMPAEAVTVSATFAGHPVSVSLTVAGNEGTSCTAELLNDDFTAVTDTLKKNTGDKFVLRLNKDDDYSFRVEFTPGGDAIITEFNKEEYETYLAYAKQNKISVPLNTVLAWVTMPGVSEDSVTMTVTFSKLQTFTILYQPTGNSARAWCKFAVTKDSQEALYASEMNSDAEMGDGSKVYSFSVTAAFIPEKVAFVSTENASLTETDATALQTSLDNAAMTNVTASQTAPAQDSDWTSITNSGKFCVIGGNARTFIAAFVTDASAMTVYNSDTAEVDKGEKTNGVTYRVAVCVMDDSGNVTAAGTVTAPEAPAKDNYDFAGWKGFEGAAQKIYNPGDKISVRENTSLNAVYTHKNLSITLNLNGGTGGSNVSSVTYGSALTITENPAKNGYSFDGWTVGTNVTENGVFFSQNSLFDFKTPITADLNLKAQWKHVHSYDCFQISDFGDKLSKYQKYATAIHIAICGCGDVQLMAHEFDSNGKCACGYAAELPETVTLNVSYGQWANGTYTEKMQELPETVKREQEVSIFAPGSWGSLQFSKWQYSANGSAWYDLTSYAYASFLIPASMTVRALYVNPVTNPQVDLSARRYDDYTEVGGKTYTMDNILFHMNYKLPDGCTFVDAGIKLGDNTGISYYELKYKKIGLTLDGRGTLFGLGALSSVVGFFAGDVDMMTTGGKAVSASASLPEYSTYYAERENSVLNEISAETLAQYMYEGKPINVEKSDPIYWQAKAVTKGMSGSMATLPPLRFAQKNNQNHYIYGIGWMRYKDSGGNVKTIYTPALAATVNNIPANTVSKNGS